MKITYLHLSDLHLTDGGTKNATDAFNQQIVTRSMVTAIGELSVRPDFIVITGDIAFSGRADEYRVCEVFVNELLSSAGLGRDRLFLVPGNHDVDRERITPKHLKSFYGFDTQDEITETLTDPDIFPILMRKFEDFNEFQGKRPGVACSTHRSFGFPKNSRFQKTVRNAPLISWD